MTLLDREKVYNVSGNSSKTPNRNEHGLFSRLSKGYLSSRLRTPKRTPKNVERFVISSPKDFNHVTHVDPRDVKGNFGNNKSEKRLPRAERPGSFYHHIPPVSKELAEEFQNSEFVPSPFARSPSINFLDEPVPVRQNLLDKFSESKKYSQSMDDLSFWSSPARRGSIQNSPLVRENRIPENPQEKTHLPVQNESQLQENRLSMPEERVSSPDSSYRSSLSSRSPSRTSPEKLSSSDRTTKAPSIEDLLAKFKTKPVRQPHRSAAVSSAFSASASSRGSCDSLNESLRSFPASRISENTPIGVSRSSVESSSFISPAAIPISCFVPQAPARGSRAVLSEHQQQQASFVHTTNHDGNHNRLSAPIPKPRSKAPPIGMSHVLSISLNNLDDDIEPDVVCNL